MVGCFCCCCLPSKISNNFLQFVFFGILLHGFLFFLLQLFVRQYSHIFDFLIISAMFLHLPKDPLNFVFLRILGSVLPHFDLLSLLFVLGFFFLFLGIVVEFYFPVLWKQNHFVLLLTGAF